MFSVLAFYSDDTISNPREFYIFLDNYFITIENKRKRARGWAIFKWPQ